MDYTKPINIVDVNNTAVKYANMLKGLNMMAVAEVLANCQPIFGVKDSIKLGKVEHGSISKKYDGTFTGDASVGTIVPRTLTVYPVVAELADEPERYRRSFIAEVAGNMWAQKHPFELWIIQHGINLASEELFYALFNAKYDSSALKKALTDSFDSWNAVIDADIVAGLISAAEKNLYVGDAAISRSNAGEYLLDMYRSRHAALRNRDLNMWISLDVADMYDNWYRDEHDAPPFVDASGLMKLEGANGRVNLIRSAAMPTGSQRVILTTRENMVYGTDNIADLRSMKAFESGNPYLFTMTMKYVWGCQFVSVHEREFTVNDLAAYGSDSGSASS
ncbi:MAG TPA: hypothetical protein PKI15_03925 [Candidatus Cloacimonadota bacterium]|nr:hypothetical protein [Candidatus Cloacimonadota bacterium]